MPGFLLHKNATVLCPHGGNAVPVNVSPRVTVSGNAIVVQATIQTVTNCSLPPPPAATGPCVTGQWVRAATRVTSNGVPVVLLDSQAVCAPTGAPFIIAGVQNRVSAT